MEAGPLRTRISRIFSAGAVFPALPEGMWLHEFELAGPAGILSGRLLPFPSGMTFSSGGLRHVLPESGRPADSNTGELEEKEWGG